MHFPKSFFVFALLAAMFLNPVGAFACDVCGCTFNTKRADGETPVGATVITPTASTMGKGHGFLGFLFDQQGHHAIPAGRANELLDAGHDLHDKRHEEFYTLAGGYGLSKDLDLYLSVPFVHRSSIQAEDADHLGRGEHAFGVGDLRLIGKYRFWEERVSAALLVVVKAPTGKTSAKNKSGEKFEPELQPGSGSWDCSAGLTVSRSFWQHWTLASAVQYTYRGEGAQDEKLGDVFRHDLGVSYAIRPLGQNPNVSLVLEAETQWLNRDRSRSSDKVLDSGGVVFLISPGLSIDLTKSVAAFIGAPIPVYQNLGGEHQKLKYEVLAGVSWHF